MMKSRPTHTFERQQPPKPGTTDDLKSFISKIAEHHDRFCHHCKMLISDALSMDENNVAGSTGGQATEPADASDVTAGESNGTNIRRDI